MTSPEVGSAPCLYGAYISLMQGLCGHLGLVHIFWMWRMWMDGPLARLLRCCAHHTSPHTSANTSHPSPSLDNSCLNLNLPTGVNAIVEVASSELHERYHRCSTIAKTREVSGLRQEIIKRGDKKHQPTQYHTGQSKEPLSIQAYLRSLRGHHSLQTYLWTSRIEGV